MYISCTIHPVGWEHYKVKMSFYIAQYPIFSIVQSALHFTPWYTCLIKHNLSFFGKHTAMLQLLYRLFVHKYLPLSIAKYSFIQLSELEQRQVKKRAHSFNTAAQDSNLSSLSWVWSSSHCTIACHCNIDVVCWQYAAVTSKISSRDTSMRQWPDCGCMACSSCRRIFSFCTRSRLYLGRGDSFTLLFFSWGPERPGGSGGGLLLNTQGQHHEHITSAEYPSPEVMTWLFVKSECLKTIPFTHSFTRV